jgi:hypothetical protein
MPSIPIQITGVLTYTGLEVGGGPMPGGPVVTPPIYYPPSPPVGIWPSPGHPAHPIAPGGPPGVVSPPIYYPPYPDQGLPPYPAHPIAPGGSPPGYWGGVAPPLPTHPIAPGGPPPSPSHPITLPPGTIPGTKPEHPIVIPPAPPGVPTHPIVLPPPGSAEQPEVLANWDAKAVWTPQSGWVVAVVPTPSHPGVPTPSAPSKKL